MTPRTRQLAEAIGALTAVPVLVKDRYHGWIFRDDPTMPSVFANWRPEAKPWSAGIGASMSVDADTPEAAMEGLARLVANDARERVAAAQAFVDGLRRKLDDALRALDVVEPGR
jgi:hypothetical protein